MRSARACSSVAAEVYTRKTSSCWWYATSSSSCAGRSRARSSARLIGPLLAAAARHLPRCTPRGARSLRTPGSSAALPRLRDVRSRGGEPQSASAEESGDAEEPVRRSVRRDLRRNGELAGGDLLVRVLESR